MKVHITNVYNFHSDRYGKTQQHWAAMARKLGFLEMGIFRYPVDSDTPGELSKRLDGIIAALSADDFVFVQLPTENGLEYEELLIRKIKAYRNTKVGLIIHGDYRAEALCNLADTVIYAKKAIGNSGESASVAPILMNAIKQVHEDEMTNLRNKMSLEEEMQIGFGLHDKTGNYSVWVGTVMQSIVENTSAPICFHIFHDETVSEENKRKLTYVAVQGGHRIRFHFFSKEVFTDLEARVGRFTIGAMFRIMIPELLPELSRLIYLDADLLVNRDMKELWDMDISDYCLAAVVDEDVAKGLAVPLPVKQGEVPRERYINTGVLYLNLEQIRKNGNMREAVMGYLYNANESKLPDQDAINVLYNHKMLLLDSSWNYFAIFVRRDHERGLQKRIYHYAATRCVLYSMTDMDRLYFETVSRTPWKEEVARQLALSFDRTDDRKCYWEQLLIQLCKLQPKVKFIYYGMESFAMKNLYAIVPPREGDYRVLSLSEYTPVAGERLQCRDFSALKAETDPFLVFVLPEADSGQAMKKLDELGLVNGKDYFVIPRLLNSELGGFM